MCRSCLLLCEVACQGLLLLSHGSGEIFRNCILQEKTRQDCIPCNRLKEGKQKKTKNRTMALYMCVCVTLCVIKPG